MLPAVLHLLRFYVLFNLKMMCCVPIGLIAHHSLLMSSSNIDNPDNPLYQQTDTMTTPLQTRTHTRCPICQGTHFWRECTHSAIASCHEAIKKTTILRNIDRSQYLYTRDRIVNQIPIPILRKIILDYAPDSIRADGDAFASLAQWRERTPQQARLVPSRIGILSAASNANILVMINSVYSAITNDILSHPDELAEYMPIMQRAHKTGVQWHAAVYMHRTFQEAERNMSRRDFTIEGLCSYGLQMNRYFREMKEEIQLHIANFEIAIPDIVMGTQMFPIPNDRPISRIGYRGQIFQFTTQPPEVTADMLYTPDEPRRGAIEQPDWTRGGSLADIYMDSILPTNIQLRPNTQVAEIRSRVPDTPRPSRPPRKQFPPFAIEINHLSEATSSEEDPQYADGHTCGVCWDDLTRETTCVTNCDHRFCHDCVLGVARSVRTTQTRSPHHRRSSRSKMACPMCRTNVTDVASFGESDATQTKLLELRMVLYSYNSPNTNVAAPTPPTNHDEGGDTSMDLLLNMLNDTPTTATAQVATPWTPMSHSPPL